MGIRRKPCCCSVTTPCIFGQDDFFGDDPGVDAGGALNLWDQRSGTWTTSGASGTLSVTGTNARIVYNAGQSDPSCLMSVSVTATGAIGDEALVLLDWQDDNNYYYLSIIFAGSSGNHCFSLHSVVGGTDKLLNTSYMGAAFGLTVSVAPIIKSGLDIGSGIAFMLYGVQGPLIVTVPTVLGRFAGLGTGAVATAVTFQNFVGTRADADCDSTGLPTCSGGGAITAFPQSLSWPDAYLLNPCLWDTLSGTWVASSFSGYLTTDDTNALVISNWSGPHCNGAMIINCNDMNVNGEGTYTSGNGGIARLIFNYDPATGDYSYVELDGTSPAPPNGGKWLSIWDSGTELFKGETTGGDIQVCHSQGRVVVFSGFGLLTDIEASVPTSHDRRLWGFGTGGTVPTGSVQFALIQWNPAYDSSVTEAAACEPCSLNSVCQAFATVEGAVLVYPDPIPIPKVMNVDLSGVVNGTNGCCEADYDTTFAVPFDAGCTWQLGTPPGEFIDGESSPTTYINACGLQAIILTLNVAGDFLSFSVTITLRTDTGIVTYQSASIPTPWDGVTPISVPYASIFFTTPGLCDFSGSTISIEGA